MTRVVGIVQARMGSQRLPGKVLAELGDRKVLDWTVARLARARTVDQVVVATSESPDDDPVADRAALLGVGVSRGSLHDVLDRFHAAAAEWAADHVVRVTADCPLVDPQVVDVVVTEHLRGGYDFTANRLPPPHRRTYPVGLDVEVVTRGALDLAWSEATSQADREHVMPYLYSVPGRAAVHLVDSPLDAGDVRWTVDTAEDLAALRALVRAAAAAVSTPWAELLEVWRAHPEIASINDAVTQRSASDSDPRR